MQKRGLFGPCFGRAQVIWHLSKLLLPPGWCVPCCTSAAGRLVLVLVRNPFSRTQSWFRHRWLSNHRKVGHNTWRHGKEQKDLESSLFRNLLTTESFLSLVRLFVATFFKTWRPLETICFLAIRHLLISTVGRHVETKEGFSCFSPKACCLQAATSRNADWQKLIKVCVFLELEF